MMKKNEITNKGNSNRKIVIGILMISIFVSAGILTYPSIYDYQCRTRVYDDFESVMTEIKTSNIGIISIVEKDEGTGTVSISYGVGASGVIFDKRGDAYYALTAKHAINKEDCTFKVYTIETPTRSEYEKGANRYVSHKEYYDIMPDLKIEYESADTDLAVVSFRSQDDLAVAAIADKVPDKNDRIVVIGNPSGDRFMVTYGKIKSSLTEFKADGESDLDVDQVIKHNAYEAPGSSGSGAFNQGGEIVGINIGGGTDAFERFKYGVMIPCDQVRRCIANLRYF